MMALMKIFYAFVQHSEFVCFIQPTPTNEIKASSDWMLVFCPSSIPPYNTQPRRASFCSIPTTAQNTS